METQPLLLPIHEVARLLGIGETLTRELVKTGELPSVRLKRAVRVPRLPLDKWLERRTNGSRLGAELAMPSAPPPRRGPRSRGAPPPTGRHPKAYKAKRDGRLA